MPSGEEHKDPKASSFTGKGSFDLGSIPDNATISSTTLTLWANQIRGGHLPLAASPMRATKPPILPNLCPFTGFHEAGFLFDISERYTPQTRLVPTAEEVAPWIDTILRLWDEEAFYQQERNRCLAAAEAWRPERLLPRFEEFFGRVVGSACVSGS